MTKKISQLTPMLTLEDGDLFEVVNISDTSISPTGKSESATIEVVEAKLSADGFIKADNVLTKTNTTSYTPTADYHPATKKYVDDNGGGSGTFVPQVQYITSSGTYNAPTGATKMEIELYGAGGGGGAGRSAVGGTGGASVIVYNSITLTASGGGGGVGGDNGTGSGGAGGGATGGDINISGNCGQAGRSINPNYYSQGGGGTFPGNGGCGGPNTDGNGGGGGQGGILRKFDIAYNLTITIGSGGAGASVNGAGTGGGDGLAIIRWY